MTISWNPLNLSFLDGPYPTGSVEKIREDIEWYTFYAEPGIQFGIKYLVPRTNHIRCYFNELVRRTANLLNKNYYSIDPPDANVISVVAEPTVTYPSYVDLVMGDMINGKRYLFQITVGKIRSSSGEFLNVGNNTKYFDGMSDDPSGMLVIPLSSTNIRVIFKDQIGQDDQLLVASRYVWTENLVTLSVVLDTWYSVILTTTQQLPGVTYTLTVT